MSPSRIATITLALSCLAAAAQAQVTVYGLLDMSYGKSLADDAAGRRNDFHSGGDNGSGEGNSTSRVGVRGSMDVGDGVKASFNLQTGGITSNGEVNPGGAFFNREAWLGMSGAFGEVRLGRQTSLPYQTMIDYDLNGASNGVSALGYTGVGMWARGRQSRLLQYILPTLATGLTMRLGYVPVGNSAVAGQKAVYSAGAKYDAGDLSGAVALQSKATTSGKDFVSLGGAWSLGDLKLMLGYADGGRVSAGGTGRGPSAGVSYSVAGVTLGALASQRTDSGAKAKAAEVFANKKVFKNTIAYVEAGHGTRDGAASGTGYAAGVIFFF